MDCEKKLLSCEGWNLKLHAIQKLQDELSGNRKQNIKEISTLALNCDFCDIGEKYIQEAISSSKDNLLLGPCVLQIGKVRNVSAPKGSEHSNVAPRMLRITLTDGNTSVTAIEFEHIDQISLKTPPGTKVKLIGSIVISSGLLQLHPGCAKVLGGRVEKLYAKWKIAMEMAGLSRIGIVSDGAPPPFVAFGKPVTNYMKNKENTKSLEVKQTEENDDDEFGEQRKAAIAEVAKITGASKTFQPANKTNLPNSQPEGFSNRHTSFANKRNNNHNERKTNRHETEPKESGRSSGMYRELSTESGENVHQKTVNEFVNMGFKHGDVVLCLRKSNNNFEVAMDLLLSMSKDSAEPDPPVHKSGYDAEAHDNRRGHGGRRGGGRMAGRGRGRGRSKYDKEDDPVSYSSNSATLFDFLESKISTVAISNDKPDEMNTHDPRNQGHHQNERNNQYEYRKESGYRGNQTGPSDSYRKPPKYGNENDHYRNDRGNQNRRGAGRNNRGRGNNRSDTRMTNQNERRGNQQLNSNESGKRYSSNRTSGETRNTDKRNFHDIPEFGTSANDYKKENWDKHRHLNGKDERSLPPRFQKNTFESDGRQRFNQNQETTRKVIDNNDKTSSISNKAPPKNENDKKVFSHTNFTVKQVNEASFSGIPLNPPPQQRGPTTFGDTNKKNKPHHPRINEARLEPVVHVTLPQWQIGYQCMAKYWEDGCFYEAVVTDLHNTAPTAVVQFVGFGNYEEVPLFDIKPLAIQMTENSGAQLQSGQGPMQNNSSSSSTRNRTTGKPPMMLYRPPPSRNVT